MPSRVINGLLRRFTGVKISDFGCAFNGYRRDAIEPLMGAIGRQKFTKALVVQSGVSVEEVDVSDEVVDYIAAIVRATRELPSVELGASPRAAVHLLAVSKARARLAGRGFVTPDDVVEAAPAVLRHRLVLRPEAELERYRPDDAIATVLQSLSVPR